MIRQKKSPAGCSKRPSSAAAASEEARRTLRYVEPLSDARTKLADFFSSLLKDFSILLRMHPRLVGKAEGGTVGIAGVVEIDSIVPADCFHRHFKGNGLGIQIARYMRTTSQGADHVRLRVLGIGHNVDVGDGVVPQFVAGRCGRQEIGQGAGKPIIFKPLQKSDDLAVGCFWRDSETDGIHVRDGCLDFEEYRRRFEIFDDRSGWPFRSGGLFVLRAGHDEEHKKPES